MKQKKPVKKSLSAEEISVSESNISPKIDPDDLPIEKPKFICSICKKNFSDKNCLKKHIRKIHKVEPEPLLPCKDLGFL